VRDDGDPAGYVAAYRIPVDERLGDRLAEVWSLTARETWTALEWGGTANVSTVAVVCAFRTDDAPVKPPLPGLQVQRGLQIPLLMAMDPGQSTDRFGYLFEPIDAESATELPAVETVPRA
jgi:type VII secretion protein EccE